MFLISTGGNEDSFDLTDKIMENEWVSVDIPLSEYESPVDLAKINQLKVTGNGNVSFGNLYFYELLENLL